MKPALRWLLKFFIGCAQGIAGAFAIYLLGMVLVMVFSK